MAICVIIIYYSRDIFKYYYFRQSQVAQAGLEFAVSEDRL